MVKRNARKAGNGARWRCKGEEGNAVRSRCGSGSQVSVYYGFNCPLMRLGCGRSSVSFSNPGNVNSHAFTFCLLVCTALSPSKQPTARVYSAGDRNVVRHHVDFYRTDIRKPGAGQPITRQRQIIVLFSRLKLTA